MNTAANKALADAIRVALAQMPPGQRSQAWLARAIGIDAKTFSRKMQRRSDWRFSELVAIADAVGVRTADLVRGEA